MTATKKPFDCGGVMIVDHTRVYDLRPFCSYIRKAFAGIPAEDFRRILTLNFYDECPSHLPVVARRSYYPLTEEKRGDVDIYLEHNLAGMSSFHSRKTKVTGFFDAVFVHTVGKHFIADTLFHEVGHLVYDATLSPSGGDDKDASEEYAIKYAAAIYGRMHPIRQGLYPIFNRLYHVFYRHRIRHYNETSEETKSVQRNAPDRQETAPASR